MTDNAKHTPATREPWAVAAIKNGSIVGDETTGIAFDKLHVLGSNATIARVYRREDAARIRSCVNACAGLNPEAIPALVEACEEGLRVQTLPFDHPDKRDLPKVLRAALAAVRGSK